MKSEFFQEPYQLFLKWFAEAKKHPQISEPTAMNIATVKADGRPASRMVLLKEYEPDQFIFYTNLTSDKAKELALNPYLAINFYWMPLKKQIRITGKASLIDPKRADNYFQQRPDGSKLSAWASKQSQTMAQADDFAKRLARYQEKFSGQPIVRPDFWSGFMVNADQYEFWQEKQYRRHDRFRYQKQDNQWLSARLYP